MNPYRRDLLKLGGLLLAGPGLVLPAAATQADAAVFLSAASDPQGRHWVRAFALHADKENGSVTEAFAHQLPERAHHIASHGGAGLYVVVARRPGSFLVVGDLASGRVLKEIRLPDGRHLFGHGVFSADGSLFHAVENDYRDMDGDSGRVVTWRFERAGDTLTARRVRDVPSHGVGPHELLLMPDGARLVVANGGIRTHPDSERDILNPDSMQPSLVYLGGHGELLEQRQLAPEYHQCSIRHLDVSADGTVAIAMQYQGLPFDDVPLVALHRRGGEIRFPAIPWETQQRMDQYCGSVRFAADAEHFAVSCPRGNMITFWNARKEEFIGQVRSRDGCGLCALGDGFVYTAGATGRVSFYDLKAGASRELSGESEALRLWDNHLTRVEV